MFEFRIVRKNMILFVKNPPDKSQSVSSTNSNDYNMNFSNMFSNITNVKPGCRKCSGTY